jgi:hypothetical protein
LEEGAKFAANAMKPEDVQMIQARRFGIEEIARAYRIAPHLLQDLTHGTYSNITELGKEFITYTMVPWFQRWLGEINRRLLVPPYFAKFNARAFMQANHAERADFYQKLFRVGGFTINEILAREDENPIDSEIGDVRFVSTDLAPVTTLINPPQEPEAPPPEVPPQGDEPESQAWQAMTMMLYDQERTERIDGDRRGKQRANSLEESIRAGHEETNKSMVDFQTQVNVGRA